MKFSLLVLAFIMPYAMARYHHYNHFRDGEMKRGAMPICKPKNGQWGGWSEWSQCSKSCGAGRHHRTRHCNSKQPQYGGNDCETGLHQESRPCKLVACPGESRWGKWHKCVKASNGNYYRHKLCILPSHGECYIDGCDGKLRENLECPCEKKIWKSWESWGKCRLNPITGKGIKTRTRICSEVSIDADCVKDLCDGKSKDTQTDDCHCVAQKFGAWGPWGKCIDGEKSRKRNCNAVYDADCVIDKCHGKRHEIDTAKCHCGTKKWSDFGEWDVKCELFEVGKSTRTRTCIVKEPVNTDCFIGECNGRNKDIRSCEPGPCHQCRLNAIAEGKEKGKPGFVGHACEVSYSTCKSLKANSKEVGIRTMFMSNDWFFIHCGARSWCKPCATRQLVYNQACGQCEATRNGPCTGPNKWQGDAEESEITKEDRENDILDDDDMW